MTPDPWIPAALMQLALKNADAEAKLNYIVDELIKLVVKHGPRKCSDPVCSGMGCEWQRDPVEWGMEEYEDPARILGIL